MFYQEAIVMLTIFSQTKKKRPPRRVAEDSGIDPTPNGDTQMDVDQKPSVSRTRNLDDNFVDDDELQASLARARRAKTMKRKVMTQEEIARKRKLLSYNFLSTSL